MTSTVTPTWWFIALVPLLVALLLLARTLRRSGLVLGGAFSERPKNFHPRPEPRRDGTSRLAEAIVLACMGLVILVLEATNPSTGGLLTMLGRLQPAFARANVLLAAAALVGVLIGVLVAAFWRTSAGALVMAAVLCVYGLVLNGPGDLLAAIAPGNSAACRVSYTIDVAGPNIVGADLWVNDVHLGKTPVQTTLDEFLEAVPYWPEPPEGFNNPENEVPVVRRYSPGGGWAGTRHQRLIEFPVPDVPERFGTRRHGDGEATRTYYARLKLGEEELHGRFSGSGGSGGKYTYSARTTIEVSAPVREQRLESLLDRARLADYAPGPEWFDAIETYGEDGSIALRKAPDWESGMTHTLDAWATWRYGLDTATDADSAWAALEGVCREAEKRRCYFTSSVAGRAVELLVPKLPSERLVARAEKLIRASRSVNWWSWEMNGRPQFGISYRSELFDPGTGAMTSRWHITGGRMLPVSAYPIAHAVWRLDQLLDSRDDTEPNIVERRIAPALICWHPHNDQALQLAARLGGPAVEQFLLAQDWRAPVEHRASRWRRTRMHMGGFEVNRWLHLLANLSGPAGDEFRRDYVRYVMELADTLVSEDTERRAPDFLFLDLHRGKQSLALKYWPRYLKLAGDDHYFGPSSALEYLARMGGLSTVDMYLDAWRRTINYDDFSDDALDRLSELPTETHREVLRALIDDAQVVVDSATDEEKRRRREGAVRTLQNKLNVITEDGFAKVWVANLQGRNAERYRESVPVWLVHDRPDHPLLAMLAENADPELRLLVPDVLRAHPTAANRTILQKLLHDPDERVRAAAETAQARMQELAARPLPSLTSQPGAAGTH